MAKRVKSEVRGRNADEIVELNLDNCQGANGAISDVGDEFVNVGILSLINCGLTTLKGFPKMPALQRLELSDNRLSNGLEHLSDSPGITHLHLMGNQIADVDALEPLKSMEALTSLDMFGCPITKIEQYREKVFKLLPQLVYLDGFDANNQEIEESDAEEDEDDDDDDFAGVSDEDGEGYDEDANEEEDDDAGALVPQQPSSRKRKHESSDNDEDDA